MGVSLPMFLASELHRRHMIQPLPSFSVSVFSNYSYSSILKNMHSTNPKLLYEDMYKFFPNKEREAVLFCSFTLFLLVSVNLQEICLLRNGCWFFPIICLSYTDWLNLSKHTAYHSRVDHFHAPQFLHLRMIHNTTY